jgi:hypothetical protein
MTWLRQHFRWMATRKFVVGVGLALLTFGTAFYVWHSTRPLDLDASSLIRARKNLDDLEQQYSTSAPESSATQRFDGSKQALCDHLFQALVGLKAEELSRAQVGFADHALDPTPAGELWRQNAWRDLMTGIEFETWSEFVRNALELQKSSTNTESLPEHACTFVHAQVARRVYQKRINELAFAWQRSQDLVDVLGGQRVLTRYARAREAAEHSQGEYLEQLQRTAPPDFLDFARRTSGEWFVVTGTTLPDENGCLVRQLGRDGCVVDGAPDEANESTNRASRATDRLLGLAVAPNGRFVHVATKNSPWQTLDLDANQPETVKSDLPAQFEKDLPVQDAPLARYDGRHLLSAKSGRDSFWLTYNRRSVLLTQGSSHDDIVGAYPMTAKPAIAAARPGAAVVALDDGRIVGFELNGKTLESKVLRDVDARSVLLAATRDSIRAQEALETAARKLVEDAERRLMRVHIGDRLHPDLPELYELPAPATWDVPYDTPTILRWLSRAATAAYTLRALTNEGLSCNASGSHGRCKAFFGYGDAPTLSSEVEVRLEPAKWIPRHELDGAVTDIPVLPIGGSRAGVPVPGWKRSTTARLVLRRPVPLDAISVVESRSAETPSDTTLPPSSPREVVATEPLELGIGWYHASVVASERELLTSKVEGADDASPMLSLDMTNSMLDPFVNPTYLQEALRELGLPAYFEIREAWVQAIPVPAGRRQTFAPSTVFRVQLSLAIPALEPGVVVPAQLAFELTSITAASLAGATRMLAVDALDRWVASAAHSTGKGYLVESLAPLKVAVLTSEPGMGGTLRHIRFGPQGMAKDEAGEEMSGGSPLLWVAAATQADGASGRKTSQAVLAYEEALRELITSSYDVLLSSNEGAVPDPFMNTRTIPYSKALLIGRALLDSMESSVRCEVPPCEARSPADGEGHADRGLLRTIAGADVARNQVAIRLEERLKLIGAGSNSVLPQKPIDSKEISQFDESEALAGDIETASRRMIDDMLASQRPAAFDAEKLVSAVHWAAKAKKRVWSIDADRAVKKFAKTHLESAKNVCNRSDGSLILSSFDDGTDVIALEVSKTLEPWCIPVMAAFNLDVAAAQSWLAYNVDHLRTAALADLEWRAIEENWPGAIAAAVGLPSEPSGEIAESLEQGFDVVARAERAVAQSICDQVNTVVTGSAGADCADTLALVSEIGGSAPRVKLKLPGVDAVVFDFGDRNQLKNTLERHVLESTQAQLRAELSKVAFAEIARQPEFLDDCKQLVVDPAVCKSAEKFTAYVANGRMEEELESRVVAAIRGTVDNLALTYGEQLFRLKAGLTQDPPHPLAEKDLREKLEQMGQTLIKRHGQAIVARVTEQFPDFKANADMLTRQWNERVAHALRKACGDANCAGLEDAMKSVAMTAFTQIAAGATEVEALRKISEVRARAFVEDMTNKYPKEVALCQNGTPGLSEDILSCVLDQMRRTSSARIEDHLKQRSVLFSQLTLPEGVQDVIASCLSRNVPVATCKKRAEKELQQRGLQILKDSGLPASLRDFESAANKTKQDIVIACSKSPNNFTSFSFECAPTARGLQIVGTGTIFDVDNVKISGGISIDPEQNKLVVREWGQLVFEPSLESLLNEHLTAKLPEGARLSEVSLSERGIAVSLTYDIRELPMASRITLNLPWNDLLNPDIKLRLNPVGALCGVIAKPFENGGSVALWGLTISRFDRELCQTESKFFEELDWGAKLDIVGTVIPVNISFNTKRRSLKVTPDMTTLTSLVVDFGQGIIVKTDDPAYSLSNGLELFLRAGIKPPSLPLQFQAGFSASSAGIRFRGPIRLDIPGWFDAPPFSVGRGFVELNPKAKILGIGGSLTVAPGESTSKVARVDGTATVALREVVLTSKGQLVLINALPIAESTAIFDLNKRKVDVSFGTAPTLKDLIAINANLLLHATPERDENFLLFDGKGELFKAEIAKTRVELKRSLAGSFVATLNVLDANVDFCITVEEQLSNPDATGHAELNLGKLAGVDVTIHASRAKVSTGARVKVAGIPVSTVIETTSFAELDPLLIVSALLDQVLDIRINSLALSGLSFGGGGSGKSGVDLSSGGNTSFIPPDLKPQYPAPPPQFLPPASAGEASFGRWEKVSYAKYETREGCEFKLGVCFKPKKWTEEVHKFVDSSMERRYVASGLGSNPDAAYQQKALTTQYGQLFLVLQSSGLAVLEHERQGPIWRGIAIPHDGNPASVKVQPIAAAHWNGKMYALLARPGSAGGKVLVIVEESGRMDTPFTLPGFEQAAAKLLNVMENTHADPRVVNDLASAILKTALAANGLDSTVAVAGGICWQPVGGDTEPAQLGYYEAAQFRWLSVNACEGWPSLAPVRNWMGAPGCTDRPCGIGLVNSNGTDSGALVFEWVDGRSSTNVARLYATESKFNIDGKFFDAGSCGQQNCFANDAARKWVPIVRADPGDLLSAVLDVSIDKGQNWWVVIGSDQSPPCLGATAAPLRLAQRYSKNDRENDNDQFNYWSACNRCAGDGKRLAQYSGSWKEVRKWLNDSSRAGLSPKELPQNPAAYAALLARGDAFSAGWKYDPIGALKSSCSVNEN